MSQFEDHPNYNCKITLDSEKEYLVYANWIHNQDLDHWHGWKCDVGHTRFYLDKNFDIWAGECKNNYLGNMLDEWTIQTDNVCKQKTCTGCTDDLITKKQQL